ncbi:MAG TPA: murein biosynthesis integral membrane protein MurJ [Candidatus Omnitrophota bacterium]|nr:murein biosynthesis integral membrane protein MurJ [Candidatus Omnitrophota bacterium]
MSIDKYRSHDSRKGLTRSAGIIGLATFLSRILGFIRDIIIARLFGVYVYSQAFVIAFKIPNLFRDLVGEGATNAAIVPVLGEYLAQDRKKEFWEAANVLMNLLLVVLAGITVLGVIFSPVLIRLIAPGFTADPEKFAATVTLNRLIFPYILLIGLTAYAMGILNSLRHFTIPAFAPCLLNISIIVFALIWGEGIRGLASGVLVGGALQLAVQIPLLHRKGFRFSLNGNFRHPAIRKIGKLMTPRLLSSAIYQLNNFVDSIFGSLAFIVGEGGVAALYFSYRLIQFPLGIFGNSLSQALLPALSCQAAQNDYVKLKDTLLFGLRGVFFVMIPASVAFMVLSRPMVSALFGGGRFNAYSAQITSGALFFYSIGLFAYGATKILQCGYFALKDTVTPTKVSAISLVLNCALNAALMFSLKLNGLALATSISGISGFLILLVILRKKLGGLGLRGLIDFCVRVFLASVVMGEVCFIISGYPLGSGVPLLARAVNLLLPIAGGMLAYFAMCALLKVNYLQGILWKR